MAQYSLHLAHEMGIAMNLLNDKKQVVETLLDPSFSQWYYRYSSLGAGNRKGIYRQQLISLLQKQEKFEVVETKYLLLPYRRPTNYSCWEMRKDSLV